ncbi:thrombospondin type 3 repeat-containing protein [Oligoflexus tunisiensis]|uniref:thrombospondin type 3 repeat-containing protein n=1 Tax=Oligoflexus tunisiensis TaxID=708132 RepID=UPI001C401924|nr:thrombospondin type 3 repeat-containing protein [Oligoflexus tunisiensis]
MTCPQPLEVTSAPTTCVQTEAGSSDWTYIEGTVLTFEQPVIGGGILYNGQGVLTCTGCGCREEAIARQAKRLSCPDAVISPALINAHDHLGWAAAKPGDWGQERFEHRNDWRGGKREHDKIRVPKSGDDVANALGEIRQLMIGTASIAGSSAVAGFLRNLDDSRYLEGLITEPVYYNTFPLENSSDYDFRVGDCAYARQKYIPDMAYGLNLMHVAEGIDDAARNEFLCLSSAEQGGFDVTAPNNSYVHAIGLLTPDAQKMAARGTAVVWSPRSNVSLYGNTAPVTLYRQLGINIALGTDWTPSGSAHLNREIQCAAQLNAKYYDYAFSDRDLWLMVTAQAASALKAEQRLGRLVPGLIADVAIYRSQDARNPYQAVFQAEARDTALVIRGGQVLYGDAALLDSMQASCQEIDVCGTPKKLCYENQSAALKAAGIADFAAFQEAVKNDYPLFFCEKPAEEPVCEPVRAGSYEGPKEEDGDGDGVLNPADNCPKVFNPIRPVDHGLQADFDQDGHGDSCDVCPAGDGEALCAQARAEDRDHDEVPDYRDNCPLLKNADQLDFDQDGRGDLCDPCASLSNPDLQSCPVQAIQQLKFPVSGLEGIKLKAKVHLSGLVTAVASTGFYLQDGESTKPSGIFVYQPKGQKPQLGQTIRITATYDVYRDQYQLQDLTAMETIAEGQTLPLHSLTAAHWNDPAALESLEGVLVRTAVSGLVSWPSDANDSAAFYIDQTIAVGQYLATYPKPLRGSTVFVSGILRKFSGRFYLEPRGPEDIEMKDPGQPVLLGFSQKHAFSEEGYEGLVTPALHLTIDRPAPEDLEITLTSQAPEKLRVPARVILPQGASTVTVPAFQGLLANPDAVPVIARLRDIEVQTTVTVLKNPKPQFLALEKDQLRAGVGATSVITLRTDLPASFLGTGEAIELTFDAGMIEVLTEPRLAAGQQEISLSLRGLAPGSTTVRARLPGSEVSWTMILIAQDISLTEVFFDPSGDDVGLEWIEIMNTSGRDLDLAEYAIGAGGQNYANLRYQLKGILPAGGCVVIGGPKSTAQNFSPNFFQAESFPGGLQNGGTAADAIGLFAMKATAITGDVLPIDAVIYGGPENRAGFKGPDGTVSAVHLPLVTSGQSMEKVDGVWKLQSRPTPGTCL